MKKLSECKILAVDDASSNIDILVDALGNLYDLSVATDGHTALAMVEQEPPDLILLDIIMPGMNGYEVMRHLKANPNTANIPVIFLTAITNIENKTEGFILGAVDYITKPFEVREVQSRVETHLSLSLARLALEQQNEILEVKVRERTEELARTQDVTIYSMAVIAEYRDPETGGHIIRTQNYVRLLAEQLRKQRKHLDILTHENITRLFKCAPLHDIGKVGIPDSVLLKPGKLSDEEWVVMKKHSEFGAKAIFSAEERLGGNSFLTFAREIASCHHEKWDGSGYPNRLIGQAIPLSARLMALADVYDALISVRVYKPPFPHSKAVEIIRDGSGTHFDPEIVEAFLLLQEEFRQTALRFADHEEERKNLLDNV